MAVFIQSNVSDGSNTITLPGVTAGSLIVLWAKWEGSAANSNISVSDGTSSFVIGSLGSLGTSVPNGQFAYLLSSSSGNKTYTVTFPSGADYLRLRVAEFSYTGTAAIDAQNVNGATSSAVTSGNITTSYANAVVLGAYSEYSIEAPSGQQISGVAAAGVIGAAGTYTQMWYRLPTATFTGAATETLSGSGDWVSGIIAFKFGTSPLSETVNSTIQSSASVSDLAARVEQVLTTIHSSSAAMDGEITGLDFPGSLATTGTIRFRFPNPHSNGLPIYGPSGNGVTYLWQARPRAQTGYYTTFFWGNDGEFQWNNGGVDTFYGAHPYPDDAYDGPGNDGSKWEIAVGDGSGAGLDIVGDAVAYDQWYTQLLRVWADGGGKHHEFYYDWPNMSKVVTYTSPTNYGETLPPYPALTFGDAPWSPSNEIYNGVLRGIQVYAAKLSDSDVASELFDPMSTSGGAAAIWYLNINPTPTDISDKSGAGHNPEWVGAERPGLYTLNAPLEVLTSTITSLATATDRQDYLEAAAILIQSGATASAMQTMIESVLTLAASNAAATDLATRVEQCLTSIQSSADVIDAISYVETLATTIQSIATSSDILQAVEQLQTTAMSAATVADVAQLVESLLTTVQSQGTIADIAAMAESALTTIHSSATVQDAINTGEQLLSTIQSSATATDILNAVEQAQTVIQSAGTVGDVAQLVEQLLTTMQSQAAATDTLQGGGQTFSETLLTTVISVAQANEAQAFAETLTTLAQSPPASRNSTAWWNPSAAPCGRSQQSRSSSFSSRMSRSWPFPPRPWWRSAATSSRCRPRLSARHRWWIYWWGRSWGGTCM